MQDHDLLARGMVARSIEREQTMKIYMHEPDYFERTLVEKQRVCLSCGHYHVGEVGNHLCDIDCHGIGYIQSAEQWCRRWKKDRRWDEDCERVEKLAETVYKEVF